MIIVCVIHTYCTYFYTYCNISAVTIGVAAILSVLVKLTQKASLRKTVYVNDENT